MARSRSRRSTGLRLRLGGPRELGLVFRLRLAMHRSRDRPRGANSRVMRDRLRPRAGDGTSLLGTHTSRGEETGLSLLI